jgi:hypothetical protein
MADEPIRFRIPALENDPQNPQEPDLPKTEPMQMSLDARKTLTGDILVGDHLDIDIVILPGKFKVLTLAKEEYNDSVYDAQNRMIEFLRKRGVIDFDSVQGGNVYGSMEMTYPEESINGGNTHQIILFTVGKWIDEEREYFEWRREYDRQEEERLLEPDDEETTELGQVQQKKKKGSLPSSPHYLYPGSFRSAI